MSNVDLVGDLERVRGPKLPLAVLPLVLVLHAVLVVVVVVAVVSLRRQWVIHARRLAGLVRKHGDLAEVGDLHDHRVVIRWEGLLPRLPVDPHERVVRRPFVELEMEQRSQSPGKCPP